MIRRLAQVAITVAVPIALAGYCCRTQTITVPNMGVDRTRVAADGDKTVAVTSDPARIGTVLAFMSGHRNGWSESWGTVPTPMLTAGLTRSGGYVAVLWISHGGQWIGWREGDDKLIRDLIGSDRATLLRDLGVPADYDWR